VLLVLSARATVADETPWSETARYRLEYRIDRAALDDLSAGHVRLWVPYPVGNADQRIERAEIESPWPHQLHSDELGNRMVLVEGDGAPAKSLTMRFVIERRPSKGLAPAAVTAGSPDDPQRFLQPNRLIPLEGLIREIAEQQSRGLDESDKKIRAFYDYVVKNLRYNKDGTGWGRGDAIWACANQRGNCTDFHSLFIGMARSQKIPARFVIGLPIPPGAAGDIPGYHCWAEYWDAARGWVPLDASEANKSGKPDAYFGALPNDRIQFTTGRDLTLVPPQKGPPLNFFIYPYAEADGRPIEKVPATFRFERLPRQTARR
jgi:transglutaminase-like putative cysteine protease